MGAEGSEARPGATSRTAQAKATARTQRSPFPAAVCGHRSAKRKEGRPPVGFPGTHPHVSTASRGHRRHACRVPAPTPPSARSPGPTSEATAGSHAAPSEFTARRCRPPCPGRPRGPAHSRCPGPGSAPPAPSARGRGPPPPPSTSTSACRARCAGASG